MAEELAARIVALLQAHQVVAGESSGCCCGVATFSAWGQMAHVAEVVARAVSMLGEQVTRRPAGCYPPYDPDLLPDAPSAAGAGTTADREPADG